jgi:hypothetical protein
MKTQAQNWKQFPPLILAGQVGFFLSIWQRCHAILGYLEVLMSIQAFNFSISIDNDLHSSRQRCSVVLLEVLPLLKFTQVGSIILLYF